MAMANRLYGKAKQAFAAKQIDWMEDTIRAVLVSGAYSPDTDADEFLSDIPAAAIEATSVPLTKKRNVLGELGAANVTLRNTAGDECPFIVLVQDTGDAAISRLLVLYDTAPGLPVKLGGHITPEWADGVCFSL